MPIASISPFSYFLKKRLFLNKPTQPISSISIPPNFLYLNNKIKSLTSRFAFWESKSISSIEQIIMTSTTGELVTVDPSELKFPFELNKQISSSLQLINKTDNHVGFKVKTTNPKKYCVRPNTGVVLPRSSCEIIVTMQAQKEAPADMQCRDKFLLQSVVASPGATPKDITPEMFSKEAGHAVEECKLRVVYLPATPATSVLTQGTEEVFSPIDKGNLSGPEASRNYVDSHDKSSEVRSLLSQLTNEKNAAIEQCNRIRQEMELLKRGSNKSQGGGASLFFVIVVALIGLILGYILNK